MGAEARITSRADCGGRWIPEGAVTGIGSLPLADPLEAIEFVSEACPVLPFCPQPPGDLLEVTLAEQFGPDNKARATAALFVDAVLRGGFPQAQALKTQLTGPITLAGLLGDRRGDGDTTALLEALASGVAQKAADEVSVLAVAGLPVLVYVDEPALVIVEPTQATGVFALVEGVLSAIRSAGGRAGVHCCAALAPGLPGRLGSEIVSYDATPDLVPGSSDLHVLGDAERLVSFGLVGVSAPSPGTGAAFSHWLAAASSVADPRELARRTIVTPSCGLGGSSMAEAEQAFRTSAEVSALVASVAQGVRSISHGEPQSERQR
jgi:methionine synthase II (cobalamin-independent)